MIEVIDIGNKEKWDNVIMTFPYSDIYYTHAYNMALMLHGDGRPQLIYYQSPRVRLVYVMFQNDISELQVFRDILRRRCYFDWTSPYGYGGPLIDGVLEDRTIAEFRKELQEYSLEQHIVSQFLRFHPLLQNHKQFADICELKCLKKTVSIDVSDYQGIDGNMASECRNRVRKAEKNDINIVWDKGERLDDFIEIYQMTMDHHEADEYYYFKKEYFQYMIDNMRNNIVFFYAQKDNRIVSAGLFLYNDIYIHYHLGGTRIEYRRYAPFNLLLREVARWANRKGMQQFHLGGGLAAEDTLFRFKKKFCPQGVRDFYIGRTIFDQEIFDHLVSLREQVDNSYDQGASFLIKYRA